MFQRNKTAFNLIALVFGNESIKMLLLRNIINQAFEKEMAYYVSKTLQYQHVETQSMSMIVDSTVKHGTIPMQSSHSEKLLSSTPEN
jgi:hypothetical protein